MPQLERTLGIRREDLPLLWDCDFLLGERASEGDERYVLCEINVSSVAPFPDSAIEPLVDAAVSRIEAEQRGRRPAPQSPAMTSPRADLPLEGGCTCRAVRFRLASRPLFVHCCHCTWCQRESGASFALNAMIESERVELLSGCARAGRHAVGERRRPADRALPALPRRGLEPLRRCRRRDPLRPRRHARRARPAAARHPHLHGLEAALGGPAARDAGGAGVLRPQAVLARREPGASRRDARARRPARSAPSS